MDDGAVVATDLRDAPAARRRRKLGATRLGRALTLAVALAALVPAGAQARTTLLGRSTLGHPIQLIEVGDPNGIPVLVVGCIHGTEPAGIPVAQLLERNPPPGVHLFIVPVLNPDGRARDTRGNAHGVDLNRNFPYRWRPFSGVYYSGPRPLSEVEARLAYGLIRRVHPAVSVWFHQHLDLVWASGGSQRVTHAFARAAGLRWARLPPLRGSAIDWQNHALPGTTAFAAELPAGWPTAAARDRYARAVAAAARASRRTP